MDEEEEEEEDEGVRTVGRCNQLPAAVAGQQHLAADNKAPLKSDLAETAE